MIRTPSCSKNGLLAINFAPLSQRISSLPVLYLLLSLIDQHTPPPGKWPFGSWAPGAGGGAGTPPAWRPAATAPTPCRASALSPPPAPCSASARPPPPGPG